MKTCPRCNLRYPDSGTVCFVDGASLVSMPDPRLGTVLAGQYVIERVLAEGGMATVYVARHRLIDRRCAIKVLNATLRHNKVVRERFAREASAAQKLSHPNIIEILDQGVTDDGIPFLVMELLSGETLATALTRGPLPLWRALSVMVQIARALSRAHDMGVIHRDLKPDNIFLCDVTQMDAVKLLDFGIARSLHDPRLTGQGEIFGTAQYLAPERISSIDAGHAADLYSFGIIAFEMLTGRLPFAASDAASWLVSHISGQIPSVASFGVSVPRELDSLVQSLMAKKPSLRPVDAHRVLSDLLAIGASAGLCILPEHDKTVTSSWQPPAKPEQPHAPDSWARRIMLFERMLSTAYGPRPPASMQSLLLQIRGKAGHAAALRASEAASQAKLGRLRAAEREGHQRLGFAADALGHDLSRAREEARRVRAEAEDRSTRCARLAAHVEHLSHEMRILENQISQGPPPGLSQLWRTAAEAMDAWEKEAEAQAATDRGAEQAEKIVLDLEYQIHELRAGLDRLSQATEHERRQLEASIGHTGCELERLQNELLVHAAEFCSPLRTFPNLASMFLELETET